MVLVAAKSERMSERGCVLSECGTFQGVIITTSLGEGNNKRKGGEGRGEGKIKIEARNQKG